MRRAGPPEREHRPAPSRSESRDEQRSARAEVDPVDVVPVVPEVERRSRPGGGPEERVRSRPASSFGSNASRGGSAGVRARERGGWIEPPPPVKRSRPQRAARQPFAGIASAAVRSRMRRHLVGGERRASVASSIAAAAVTCGAAKHVPSAVAVLLRPTARVALVGTGGTRCGELQREGREDRPRPVRRCR